MKTPKPAKITLILLLAFAAAGILCVAVSFAQATCYTSGDELIVNGQKQSLLEKYEWGAFMIDYDNMGSLQYDTSSGGDFKVSTPGGTVVFDKDSSGVIKMKTPDYTATVERKTEDLVVNYKGKTYTFRLWGKPNEISMDLGFDQIKVEYQGMSGYYTITGKQGQVIYKPMDSWQTCSVTSPVGTTTYKVVDKANESKGYEITGPPPTAHPYRFMGVEFYDEKYGIGIYVSLGAAMHYPPMPKQFSVDQLIMIK